MITSSEFIPYEQQQKIIYINDPQFPSNKLIINADDFGISQSRDRGIVQLIRQKRVTSISVLVNGSNIQQSVETIKDIVYNTAYRAENAQIYLLQNLSIGLHFNITEGKALYDKIICDFIQNNSQMKGKNYIYNYFAQLSDNKLPLSIKQFIKSQFRWQIQRFIQLFGIRPSHIDGHNHVHIIPQIAQLISPIMRQNGIYRVRLPLQNLSQNTTSINPLNPVFVKYATISRQIFDKQKIVYPSHFIGLQQINELNAEKISLKLKNIAFGSKRSSSNIIQIMCHPGYADPINGDDFNKSKNRQVQLANLKSEYFSQKVLKQKGIQLSNYNFLNPKFKKNPKRKIVLYSKMNCGSGNWTTSLRLYQIFESLGYDVYLRSIQQSVNSQHQTQSLRQFLIEFKMSLVVGVNLTRAGRIIYNATRSNNYISNRVPYILMVTGTDANIYFKTEEAPKVLKQPVQQCSLLISISQDMLEITKRFMKQKISLKQEEKELVLLSQSSNILSYQVQQNEKPKVYSIIKQNFNLDLNKDKGKYIIFSTSFREVKDIEFLLDQFNFLMEKYQYLRVFIAGPILSQSYYQKCRPKLGKVQYVGSLQKEIYVQFLKNALLLVNTSISEGQCCSIQQAYEVGQLSVARNNAGNAELVKNGVTGLLFNTGQQFVEIFQRVLTNQNNWVERIKQNALKYHKDNFSIEAQAKSYKIIFDKILPQRPYIFAYPDVHSVCDVNLRLYDSISPQILQKWILNQQDQKRIVDIGCGSGIFSFSVFYKIPFQYHNQIQLQQYDINRSVLSNCYYNCLQESETSLSEAKSIKLKLSDMFSNIQRPQSGNLYTANLPQSPFRYAHSRPDKNGGPQSLKFNESLVRKFSQFNSNSMLIMLYSYMSYPKRFFEILQQLNLQVIWKSQKQYHYILGKKYDQMEQNLSQYIKQHISLGRAQVTIQKNQNGQDIFKVPAQILIIQKRQKQ